MLEHASKTGALKGGCYPRLVYELVQGVIHGGCFITPRFCDCAVLQANRDIICWHHNSSAALRVLQEHDNWVEVLECTHPKAPFVPELFSGGMGKTVKKWELGTKFNPDAIKSNEEYIGHTAAVLCAVRPPPAAQTQAKKPSLLALVLARARVGFAERSRWVLTSQRWECTPCARLCAILKPEALCGCPL